MTLANPLPTLANHDDQPLSDSIRPLANLPTYIGKIYIYYIIYGIYRASNYSKYIISIMRFYLNIGKWSARSASIEKKVVLISRTTSTMHICQPVASKVRMLEINHLSLAYFWNIMLNITSSTMLGCFNFFHFSIKCGVPRGGFLE